MFFKVFESSTCHVPRATLKVLKSIYALVGKLKMQYFSIVYRNLKTNFQMKNVKNNLVLSFLNSAPKFDKNVVSVSNRKIDSKNQNADAPRYVAIDHNEKSALVDFIVSTKNAMFNETRKMHNQSIAKATLVRVFVETTEMDNFAFVASARVKLAKQFKVNAIDEIAFLAALKVCLSSHVARTTDAYEAKMKNLSVNVQKALELNPKIKENFIAYLKAFNAKAAKAKTPKAKAAKA